MSKFIMHQNISDKYITSIIVNQIIQIFLKFTSSINKCYDQISLPVTVFVIKIQQVLIGGLKPMDQTHLSLDGERIDIGFAQSILPNGKIRNDSFGSEGDAESEQLQQSEVFVKNLSSVNQYQNPENKPNLDIKVSSIKNSKNYDNLGNYNNQCEQNKFLQSILQENSPTCLKLTKKLDIQQIDSQYQNSEGSPRKPKLRSRKLYNHHKKKQFDQDQISDTEAPNSEFMEEINQKGKLIFNQQDQQINGSKSSNIQWTNKFQSKQLHTQTKNRDIQIISQNSEDHENNILSFQHQNQIPLNSDIAKSHFDIPEDDINEKYPKGKSTQQLYNISIKLFEKFGGIQVDQNKQIKINSYPNCYIFYLSQLKTIIWKDDGTFYLGGWKNNYKCGMGFQIKPMQYKYKGQFIKGKRCGKGCMKTISGIKYLGDWKNGKKQGYGEEIDVDKKVYIGEWENNLYHGKGIQKLPSGQIYKGQFKYGMKNGFIVWLKNEKGQRGDRFEGNYVNNQRQGYGQCHWENGRVQKRQLSKGFTTERKDQKFINHSRKKSFIISNGRSKTKRQSILIQKKFDNQQILLSTRKNNKFLQTISNTLQPLNLIRNSGTTQNNKINSSARKRNLQRISSNLFTINHNIYMQRNSPQKPSQLQKQTNNSQVYTGILQSSMLNTIRKDKQKRRSSFSVHKINIK